MRLNLDIRKVISLGIVFAFLINTLGPVPMARADEFRLPAPGVRVNLSPEYNPAILKGIKVHPDNPFRFDFILDQGDEYNRHPEKGRHPERSEGSQQEQLKSEATRLIKYFLASLTIPEQDLWVNLSPYEKDRIIPQSFGLTEMGRDLLAEDYMLKQITASLIYPEDTIGKKFWKRIYEEAYKKFGTTNIPVNTFNKVWIVPEKAVVYENAKAGTAYVVEAKLKVMLEQDYLSLEKHTAVSPSLVKEGVRGSFNNINALGSQIVRANPATSELSKKSRGFLLAKNILQEIVIPELTKEVNEGKNFAKLRQVYNSLILAYWYKKKIQNSILEQVYAAKNKVAGINIDDPQEKERIYQHYLQAFKKGVYNYIKEDQDPVTQEVVPRKYFSGGTTLNDEAMAATTFFSTKLPQNQGIKGLARLAKIDIDLAMAQPIKLSDKAMNATVKGRRLKEFEILNGLPEGEQITPMELTAQLNQMTEFEGVTEGMVRRDIETLDSQVQKKLSINGWNRNDVKERRNKLYGFLKELPEGEQITPMELTAQLNQVPGYGDVIAQTVSNDIAVMLDQKEKYPQAEAKLDIKEHKRVVRQKAAERRKQLYAYITKGLPPGQYTPLEITERYNRSTGEDLKVKRTRDDLAPNRLRKYPQVNAKLKIEEREKVDRDAVKARRERLYEILKRQPDGKQVTIGELTDLYNEETGEHVTVRTVTNDVDPRRLKDPEAREKLSIEELDVEAVKERRKKLYEYIEGLPTGKQYTANEIAKGYNRATGEDLNAKTVRADIVVFLDKRSEYPQAVAKLSVPPTATRTVRKYSILLEGAGNDPLLNRLKSDLVAEGYSVDVTTGIRGINEYLKSHPSISLVLSGSLIPPEILGGREFLNMYRFLDEGLKIDNDGELKLLSRIKVKFEIRQKGAFALKKPKINGGGALVNTFGVALSKAKVKPISYYDALLKRWEGGYLVDRFGMMWHVDGFPILISPNGTTERGLHIISAKNRRTDYTIPLEGAEQLFKLVPNGNGNGVKETRRNAAMVGNAQKEGGIDLTPANMNLQTKNNGDEIKFHLDPAMLQQLQNAPGFVPVIINIQPLKSLQEFLGLTRPTQSNVG